ncbi:oxidoreductase [Dendryphion nanum]|uniref:Oxidoreductase n=1 Tax=Dendryphion nanum TaxID=256645 RepID=A0A9P9CYF8_9PLEO|nr:oxidoreductase [Dendryphion nanum]
MSSHAAPTKNYHKKTYPSIDPTRPELSAKGKTIVITGGGTGIGAATANHFSAAGAARIGILGRREEPLLATKAAIEKQYPETEVLAIPTDVTKKAEVDAAFAKIANGGHIDVLVSNAAVAGALGNFADTEVDDFLWGIVTNVTGNVTVTKAFLNHASKHAVVIETNSAAAHISPAPGFASYNVSKAATARFYSSLTIEHPDLSFFSVQPGVVETDMSREAGYKPLKEGEKFIFEGANSSVLSLLARFDDSSLPASFYVWLASPEARFLNGKFLWANWDVDELKARAKEIEGGDILSFGVIGWPFN